MKRWLAVLLVIVCVGSAHADPVESPNRWDPFSFTNRDHAIHMLGGFAATYGIHQILRKTTRLTKLESLLISTLTVTLAGTIKETYIDEFASRGNQTANFIGIGTGVVFGIAFGL